MAEPQRIAGRYEVLETRALGAREELRARDRTLRREVLLVRPSAQAPLTEKSASEWALREARALAALRHPGIQQLFEAFEDGGRLTLSLEPVAGETLAERLEREGRLSSDEVRRLGVELADALAALHAAGAVHRDVSAKNIVLRADGRTCLVGFRFAKPIAFGATTSIEYVHETTTRGASEVADLPEHPGPEQFGGEAASARSDLFALGCVLYRALTGRDALPAQHTTVWSAPQDPARLVPGTPRALGQAITACLARSPIGRPQSAAELRELLRAAGEEGSAKASIPSRSSLLLGAAALVAVTAAAWRFWPHPGEDPGQRGLTFGAGNDQTHAATRGSATTYAPDFARSRALLIGIGDAYKKNGFAPLSNAVKDVEALGAALAALPRDRWETPTILVDEQATFDGIKTALSALEDALEPEDRALVYFAGHGVAHERSGTSGWLIPSDGRQLADDPGRTRWIEFVALERFLQDAQAKHVLLAMDCCYGGRMAPSRGASARAYEERFLTRRAHIVLTSGRGDEPVSDGQRGHSPFAEVLLDALQPGGTPITSSMLYSDMLRTFTERGLAQTPMLAQPEDSNGEFVFFRQ